MKRLALITIMWLMVAVAVAEVPVFEQIETKNAVQIQTANFRLGRGFFQATCYVGEETAGVFAPDNLGLRTVTIKNTPGNFLLQEMATATWTRIRAVDNADPLLDMSIIIEAYWRLVLERHLLGGEALADIDIATHIEPYVADMIAVLEGEPQEPELLVAPTTLALAGASSGTIDLTNDGIDILTWTATGLGSRITLSPPNGQLGEGQSQTVTVTVDRSGLSAGEQADDFTIVSNAGNQLVDVSVVIGDPVLELSTDTLDFGTELTELTFELANSGEAALNWQLSTSNGRITCDPSSGSTTSETVVVTATVDRDGLPANTYNETITVQIAGDNVTIDVTVVQE